MELVLLQRPFLLHRSLVTPKFGQVVTEMDTQDTGKAVKENAGICNVHRINLYFVTTPFSSLSQKELRCGEIVQRLESEVPPATKKADPLR